jgi:cysteine synthase
MWVSPGIELRVWLGKCIRSTLRAEKRDQMSHGPTDADATHWRSLLGSSEGLNVGYSAAANVCAAKRLIDSDMFGPDAVVVTLLCDSGLKYS